MSGINSLSGGMKGNESADRRRYLELLRLGNAQQLDESHQTELERLARSLGKTGEAVAIDGSHVRRFDAARAKIIPTTITRSAEAKRLAKQYREEETPAAIDALKRQHEEAMRQLLDQLKENQEKLDEAANILAQQERTGLQAVDQINEMRRDHDPLFESEALASRRDLE